LGVRLITATTCSSIPFLVDHSSISILVVVFHAMPVPLSVHLCHFFVKSVTFFVAVFIDKKLFHSFLPTHEEEDTKSLL